MLYLKQITHKSPIFYAISQQITHKSPIFYAISIQITSLTWTKILKIMFHNDHSCKPINNTRLISVSPLVSLQRPLILDLKN
jgi:hypothetical protein